MNCFITRTVNFCRQIFVLIEHSFGLALRKLAHTGRAESVATLSLLRYDFLSQGKSKIVKLLLLFIILIAVKIVKIIYFLDRYQRMHRSTWIL